jgi:capsular exopolysaccharide synthesis family protein
VQTQFVRLTREVELLDEISALLQMRLKEQEVSEADVRSSIRPLDAALVPLTPVSPRPKLNLLLALAAGLMLGVGIAVAKAVLDPAMYSREVAVEAAGGVPILISIPATRSAATRLLANGRGGRLRMPFQLVAGTNGQLAPGTVPSAAAEAYTDLRTRLATFTSPPPRVVVVTSPREGDGKSTVAANLALAYAKHGTHTLLLEGDLRRGRLAAQLRLPTASDGLGRVLHGTASSAEVIQGYPLGSDAADVLDVLLAGESPRHPAELLDSPALGQLLEDLRSRYEMIVIDTPPLDAVADALLLARLADGALLVTRAGATDRYALEKAVAELDAVGTHVHGLVLNGFAGRHVGRYAYGGA